MSKMKEIQIVIEEVARIALENQEMRDRIGHELDLSDEYLQEVFEFLESLMEQDNK